MSRAATSRAMNRAGRSSRSPFSVVETAGKAIAKNNGPRASRGAGPIV
jgi:hypothetical protein